MIASRSLVLGLALSCVRLAQAEDAAPAYPRFEAACQQSPDKCAVDPIACEQKKAAIRELMQKRQAAE